MENIIYSLLLKTNFRTYIKILNLIIFMILLYFGFGVRLSNDDILTRIQR